MTKMALKLQTCRVCNLHAFISQTTQAGRTRNKAKLLGDCRPLISSLNHVIIFEYESWSLYGRMDAGADGGEDPRGQPGTKKDGIR
jgi:hypothetical protein